MRVNFPLKGFSAQPTQHTHFPFHPQPFPMLTISLMDDVSIFNDRPTTTTLAIHDVVY